MTNTINTNEVKAFCNHEEFVPHLKDPSDRTLFVHEPYRLIDENHVLLSTSEVIKETIHELPPDQQSDFW